MRLQNRVAIITGAAGGLGRHVARRFAAAGACLTLTGRNGCAIIAAELTTAGHAVIDVPTDVTDRAASQRMVERTVEAFGRVDILVTVAGVVSTGNAETLDEREWDRVI